ncbi:PucR family transcriptional regulator [Virgibacillus sp. W0181]|uniref:PucR family transcriptional regulator n=1 Tax=Virgibacillus sp. W0181 TaxID=3391581 RepID=UPI003F466546
MAIVVREIMELPIFDTAQIKTGKDLLDQFSVEWVSSIEGPVENFVRENEFILTTGMECAQNPDLLLDFVQDVYESGASALGIATGRYIFDIPEDVINFAEEKGFILLELPWELRFADIQREAMNKINEWQEDVSERSRNIQKQLIDFVIQGEDLADIIKYVENKLGWRIVFTDSKGRVKSGQANPEEMVQLWEELDQNKAIQMDESLARHIRKVNYNGRCLLKKEISAGQGKMAQGSFLVLFPKDARITKSVLHTLENLSAAVALWISREDAIVKTEIRLRNEFIWSLAKNGKMEIDEGIYARAKLFGYDLNLPYVCIIGFSENVDSLSEDRYENSDFGLKSIVYYIEEEIRYAARVVQKQAAFTFDEDQLIIFLESKDEDQVTANHFLDLVEKRLNALMPGASFSWGIGKHGDGVLQFHESYKKAKSALDMGRQQKGPGQRVNFEDTQLSRLLLNLAADPEIRDITLATIAPLIEYDKKREMDLIETFIAYDNQNGNVSQAARVLNLHRQSLLYRLRKIESLTNLSLMNPDDVFLLNISVKVWLTGVLKE